MTDWTNETEEWIAARLGRVTASRISDVVGKRKDGLWRAERKKYTIELLAERFTGMRLDPYMSAAMLFGKETEPQAVRAYEKMSGESVYRTDPHPFIDHPSIPMCGASPDGYVGDDGLIEVKCPETHTHLGYMMDRVIPEEYVLQMIWQMECTGRKWCDFVSFDPRLPERLRPSPHRVTYSANIVR